MSNSIEAKLRDVNEATGETCSLVYDKGPDRWFVYFLKSIPTEHPLAADKKERENIGCGASVVDALDQALREVGPLTVSRN